MLLGTCSLCGGRVTVPSLWMGVIPPVARCENCGAVEAQHGPVIPMRPADPVRNWTSVGTSLDPLQTGPGTAAAGLAVYPKDCE